MLAGGPKAMAARLLSEPASDLRLLCRVLQLLDLCDSVKNDALRVISSAFNTSLHAPIAGITDP